MNTRVPSAIKSAALPALVLLFASTVASAVQPTTETLQAWQDYVETAHSRMERRLQGGAPFLWIDESAERSRRVRSGEILVAPVGGHSPIKAPRALIHDWVGAALIPNVTLEDVLAIVRDYDRYKDYYKPLVIDSKALGEAGEDDRFSLVMLNKSLLAKRALATEWKDRYLQVDEGRWYSIAYGTRVVEIEGYGSPGERQLSEAGGSYLWRLYSISRFEQRDGGVYVELEAIALSRDIPGALRWFVDPIVRRVSRGSLVTSLQQTRAAVKPTIRTSERH